MGCNAGKNVRVEEINIRQSETNGNLANKRSASVTRTTISSEELDTAALNNLQKGANGMSFEIKFDDEETDESIIQKHPPKRILDLQESQGSPPSLEKLQEKLEEAEVRRQQILQQRILSSKKRKPLLTGSESTLSQNESSVSPNHLKPPMEVPLVASSS